MIQRDYIIRLIQQLIDSLFMLLDKKDLNEEEYLNQLDKIYEDYLDNDADYFLKASIEDVATSLQQRYGKEEYLYRIEMLTEIIFQDGMHEADGLLKYAKVSKVLELLAYLESNGSTYSLVREGRIEVVRKELGQYEAKI